MRRHCSHTGARPFRRQNPRLNNQQGGTLVIALVILLVMSIVGVSNMHSSTMQERMAANNRQKSVAKYAAESALNVAQAWLDTNLTGLSVLSQFDGSGGLYSAVRISASLAPAPHTNDISDLTDANDWGTTTASTGPIMGDDLVSRQPQYVIEYIGRDYRGLADGVVTTDDLSSSAAGASTDPLFFRITAIGWGKDSKIYTVLESIYRTGSAEFFNY